MGLLSIFKRGSGTSPSEPSANDPSVDVQRARVRARQRLIGAAVLVAIGVIGFPLVFETQPRPISVDIPIEIPRKEGAPALAMPPARTSPRVAAESSAPSPAGSAPAVVAAPLPSPRDEVITETREEAGRDKPLAPRVAAVVPVPLPVPVPVPVAPAKPASRPTAVVNPAAVAVKPTPVPADSARAKALLEAKPAVPAAAPPGTRFVVQVGAFADVAAARETRAKAERLGIKTYTQVADTPAGKRVRVRMGPYPSRDEADKALAKARSAGLTAVVLTL